MIHQKISLIIHYANQLNFGSVGRVAMSVQRHLVKNDANEKAMAKIEYTMMYVITNAHRCNGPAINQACNNLLYMLYPGEVLMTLRLKKAGSHVGNLDVLPNSVLYHISKMLVPLPSPPAPGPRTRTTHGTARRILFS
jgi:hypothetical protein